MHVMIQLRTWLKRVLIYPFFHFIYQGSDEDFEKVYEQCVRCCTAFLKMNS